MSAIKNINANEGHRDVVASDRVTVYTDGYKNLFTSATTPNIDDIANGTGGTITLSNAYVTGTFNLMVYINGQLLVQPGVDYTEDDNRNITLDSFWVTLLQGDTANSTILIMWNRPLPGARDQELNNLKNVTPDIEGAVLDTGVLRVAPATALNPFATMSDLGIGPSPLAGKTFVPVEPADRIVRASAISGVLPSSVLPAPAGGVAFLEGLQIDLSAYGIIRPVGATHALVRGNVGVTLQGGDVVSNGYATLHVGPYNAAPNVMASLGIHAIAVAGENADGIPPNGDIDNNSGTLVVPLGDPSDPADLTAALEVHAIAGGGFTADDVVDWGVIVEGFYIDDTGTATPHHQVGFNAFGPLQGVVTAAGLTLPGMALIAFTSAVYNSGAYNAPASTFTAPVTGLYHFDLDVFFQQPVGSAYEISVAIVPSSGNAVQAIGQQLGSTALGVSGLGPWNLGMSLVASATVPLTLGDTVIAKFGTTHPGGPAQNAGGSHFSGYLVFPT